MPISRTPEEIREIKKLPTISSSHSVDLKIDTGTTRTWVSRCTGEVSDERLVNGRWVAV